MQKVLIANQNVEQNNAFCQHLSKDKRLEIIGITDGTTTLEKYLEIQPNILVIDSCMKDIDYIDLINRLSTNIREKRNCNIILTAGTDYIREAIFECYYYPDLQKKLIDIFSIIGKRHNKTNSAVRSGFRTALERLNMYKESIDCPIMQYFDLSQNITPKEFLEIAVMYLHHQKGKKK